MKKIPRKAKMLLCKGNRKCYEAVPLTLGSHIAFVPLFRLTAIPWNLLSKLLSGSTLLSEESEKHYRRDLTIPLLVFYPEEIKTYIQSLVQNVHRSFIQS